MLPFSLMRSPTVYPDAERLAAAAATLVADAVRSSAALSALNRTHGTPFAVTCSVRRPSGKGNMPPIAS